jgi:hypothetical protein
MNLVDLTGRRFGRWVVLSYGGHRKPDPNIYWLCRCDCGTVKTIVGNSLRGGGSKSCGCLRDDLSRQRHGLIGRRVGRLVILESLHRPRGGTTSRYRVRCDCGVQRLVWASSIKRVGQSACRCPKAQERIA